jgi:hypothetical protein
MNENEIYSGIADVLIDKPYTLVIPVRWQPPVLQVKRSLVDKLLRRPMPVPADPERYRRFEIYPAVVGNQYRIIGRAVTLPDELKAGELTESVMPLIPIHMPNMVYIIASAIQNNHLEPEPELLLFIERNFNSRQIFEALYQSIEGIGLQDFMNSIVLTKRAISIMKPRTSPEDGRELIASHTV